MYVILCYHHTQRFTLTYVCTYVHMYIHTCIQLHMYVFLFLCGHVRVCVCVPQQIISEKAKFRRNPVNYAMSKNRLMMEKVCPEYSSALCLNVCYVHVYSLLMPLNVPCIVIHPHTYVYREIHCPCYIGNVHTCMYIVVFYCCCEHRTLLCVLYVDLYLYANSSEMSNVCIS